MSRLLASLGLALAWLALSSQSVFAQVTYTYVGNNFNLFSCGGDNICSVPDPAFTSYTTDDFVTATLTLSEPLPAGLNLQNVRSFAGFSLTMNDGHQELKLAPLVPGEALVSTDAKGNIIGPWSVFINCCSFPNNNIFALNWPDVRGVGDGGALSAPTGDFPNTPRDQGMIFRSPGVWTGGMSSPEQLTQDLINEVNNLVGVELNSGQAKGLIRPLSNALRSIEHNKIQPACNQLQNFIDEVVKKTPPLRLITSDVLIAEANGIRAVLSCEHRKNKR